MTLLEFLIAKLIGDATIRHQFQIFPLKFRDLGFLTSIHISQKSISFLEHPFEDFFKCLPWSKVVRLPNTIIMILITLLLMVHVWFRKNSEKNQMF